MKNEIIALAKKQKISDIGFCSYARYSECAEKLQKAAFSCAKKLPENIKSVIVCAFSYYSGAEKGNISRYAQGADYHTVAKGKMRCICDFLMERGYCAEAFADSGALNERLLGTLSGISFVGKNRMAISRTLGSYFFIGYVLTDCEIEADGENFGKCAGCGACARACPLGALDGESFDEEKCLSFITQKKGELTEEEISAMRACGTLWGCDICQEVCPHNRDLTPTEIEEFKENLIVNLEIDENLSNREFKKIYGGRAFAWRGKGVLVRNQKCLCNR